ncbi:MAG: hypothetical protein ACFE91_10545 [Promethearchaeota archaeon]
MPGPFDELEKEAENLEKQSKEEFNQKNFVLAISKLEEAKDIYSKLGYQGKIGMIIKRIAQLKNLVKFEKQDAFVKTKGEEQFQKRVDKILEEKQQYIDNKLKEQKTLTPEMKRKLEKINLIIEKAEKEERLGKFQRAGGRYEILLEIYKSFPREIINFSKQIYEIEQKLVSIRKKL